ncbi:hypothetical protein M231_03922 [Tremella mesenterica]|uniref:Uncharacterized protein n=1 Tax=Tremella mesenterica TaxID=5217 RepID=A0A4Q1BLT6_TREME|nr:uncharacterized protein TREMEDRAFT_64842 [Tremella mesenterica DSM 1558]EIW66981.1 hypothetical protein TREMEDRAFT_64842 [Tremella mesenterica DSM 1558]RXK38746.1 hypothetical protein M231_03922 [Tremella mesenterica]
MSYQNTDGVTGSLVTFEPTEYLDPYTDEVTGETVKVSPPYEWHRMWGQKSSMEDQREDTIMVATGTQGYTHSELVTNVKEDLTGDGRETNQGSRAYEESEGVARAKTQEEEYAALASGETQLDSRRRKKSERYAGGRTPFSSSGTVTKHTSATQNPKSSRRRKA